MLTPWGYEVEDLPAILTIEEFNTLTANRWASDPLAEQAVTAASAAIRNYCGWHVAPALKCTATVPGGGRMLHLPFMGVTSVAVSVEGVEIPSTAYDWLREGIVRRIDGLWWPCRWGSVSVTATAGYEADAILKQVVVQLAGNAIAAPLGVKEEHAGQVGISYNTTNGIAGGISLTARDMACLDIYRVEGVA